MISITLKKILTFRMEDIDRFFTKLMHHIKKSSTFPLLLSINTEKTSILPQKIPMLMRRKRNALTGT